MGHLDVTQRGGPLDGGVDVVAGRVDGWGHRTELAVQAKRYAAPVGRRHVDELLGAFRRQRYAEAPCPGRRRPAGPVRRVDVIPRKTGFPCCPNGSHFLCRYAYFAYKPRSPSVPWLGRALGPHRPRCAAPSAFGGDP